MFSFQQHLMQTVILIMHTKKLLLIQIIENKKRKSTNMFHDALVPFAECLSQLREARQISAREMSLAIGQNCSYINRIENKKAFPSMQCFFYICDYLQISPQEFFDDESQAPHTLSELTESLKTLSPRQLDLITDIVIEFQKK